MMGHIMTSRTSTNSPATLIADHVTRTFVVPAGSIHAVRDVTLSLTRGSMLLIRGASGSGKTTLLNLLGGLDSPTSGEVRFEGAPLSRFSERQQYRFRRTGIGFVFQHFALLPELSARENVEIPLRIAGEAPAAAADRADEALDKVGLGARRHHRAFELSGGERQRVAVARALVKPSSVLLCDEPTGELDQATGHAILTLLASTARDRKIAICLSSHDPIALEYVDTVRTLKDGRIEDQAA